MADKYAFLSDAWFDAAAKLIDEHGADGPPPPNLVMNLEVADGDKTTEFHMGAKDGAMLFGKGHTDGADLTLSTDIDTARAVFVDNNPAGRACRRSWPARSAIQGDMTKLMMAQAGGRAATPRSPKRCRRSPSRPSSARPRRIVSRRARRRAASSKSRTRLRDLHRERLRAGRDGPDFERVGRSRCPAASSGGRVVAPCGGRRITPTSRESARCPCRLPACSPRKSRPYHDRPRHVRRWRGRTSRTIRRVLTCVATSGRRATVGQFGRDRDFARRQATGYCLGGGASFDASAASSATVQRSSLSIFSAAAPRLHPLHRCRPAR